MEAGGGGTDVDDASARTAKRLWPPGRIWLQPPGRLGNPGPVRPRHADGTNLVPSPRGFEVQISSTAESRRRRGRRRQVAQTCAVGGRMADPEGAPLDRATQSAPTDCP